MSVSAPPPPTQLETAAVEDDAFVLLSHPPTRGSRRFRLAHTIPSALAALRANKGRSVLTTLGIIIGVAAVIAIVALGEGASSSVSNQLAGLGVNVLTIVPGSTTTSGARSGAGGVSTLKVGDVADIQGKVPDIAAISPVVSGSAQVVAGSQNWSTRVSGVYPSYQELQDWQIAEGGFFTDQDDAYARNVAVIGQTVYQNLYPNGGSPIGQLIRIRNVPFTVVGVLASKGTGFGGDQDDTILIPFQTGQVRLFGASALSSIVVQVNDASNIDAVTNDMTSILRTRHELQNSQNNDFTIRNNNDVIQRVTGVSQTLTLLLGGVAAVSLVVGGIGIMNIMLVSVTERTREIGIRLAIGAQPGDVLAQFLVEAVVLSLLGGIIGIVWARRSRWCCRPSPAGRRRCPGMRSRWPSGSRP